MAASSRVRAIGAGAAMALVVFVGFGELTARQFAVIDRLNGFPRALYLATAIPDLPYRLRPGVRATVENANTGPFAVRVNALGLRGPETTARPAPGVHRTLVLGDSVVYGDGLDEAATFPAQLQRALGAAPAARFEVLNGAAPGYNTEAEAAFFREIGVHLAPQTVILGVSINDFGPAPTISPAGVLTAVPASRTHWPWLTNHSEFYLLVRWLVSYVRGEHWWQHMAAEAERKGEAIADVWRRLDAAIGVAHTRFYQRPSGPGWERVRRSLVRLRDLTAARGMRLLVVIFPDRYQVRDTPPGGGGAEPDARALAAQRAWRGLCAEFGLECVDLQPAFTAAPERPLFLDTQHPNAAGHAIAAAAVAPAVRAGEQRVRRGADGPGRTD
jgi:lysophospholipase L1-like esterase